jgi:hypothetical protein
MIRFTTYLLAGLLTFSHARAGEVFYSVTQLGAPGSPYASMFERFKSVDQLFLTEGASAKLAATKQVCMEERPLIKNGRLQQKETTRVVEVPEADFRPVLKQLSDLSNYGDSTACAFETGAILLIGEGESGKSAYVIRACFKCHDIIINCRGRDAGHEIRSMTMGMSPELESALFVLAKRMFPEDLELQKFQLASRTRATGPAKNSPLLEIPIPSSLR